MMQNENLNMEVIKDEYNKLVTLYSDIEDINEDIKLIRESLKNEGVDASLICKIAQSAVKDKKDDLVNKSQDLIDLVEALS